jgi:hypothetical protein
VGPHLDDDFAPREVDIGVMPFLFGEFADLDRKVESVPEVLERVGAFEMVFVDDLPDLPVDLLVQFV